MFCADRRDEIDRVTPDVKCVYERDNPFTNSSGIVSFLVAEDAKCDSETQFDENEGEFDPKGQAEDAMLTVVNP